MARRILPVLLVLAVVGGAWWWFGSGAQESGWLRDTSAEPGIPAAPAAPPAQADEAVPGIPPDAFAATVESVHDGDTLRVHVDTPNAVITDTASTRVRLLGIDTPEISPAVECWGAEATEALAALAPAGSTIWLAPDAEVLDQYGRHLLYLWTPDGRFINAELVSGGAARVEVYPPNREHEALLRSLEAQAQATPVGRWASC